MNTQVAHSHDSQPDSLLRELGQALRAEGDTWLFVLRTLLAFFLTGWLAMRFALPQPSSAMLTTIIVANRQAGMVLAKSFYRAIGTLVGSSMGMLIVLAFPQQRVLFLLAMALWLGVCAGGATLHRNFRSYAFVLAGYTAAIVALPVISNPLGVFDSAVARISEVLLGLLVSAVVCDTVFPSRLRDELRNAARSQFAHFIGFVQRSTAGVTPRASMDAARLRFVRDAVTLEDLRSSVVFEDAHTRARSRHLQLFNQRFMASSTSFQSLHSLINRLLRTKRQVVATALIALYAPIGEALDMPHGTGATIAPILLPRLDAARAQMRRLVGGLRTPLDDVQDQRDFDTGVTLLRRFVAELNAYIDSAAQLQVPRVRMGSPERVRFVRGNDWLSAGLATARTTLVMLALGLFWIASAWPYGSSAMLIATVFAGLFATAPSPASTTGRVFVGYATGMAAGFFCIYFVLTEMDGFGLLVAGIVPFMIPGLVAMTSVRFGSYGLGYSMGFAYILAVKNVMDFDPAHTLNDAIAQLIGLGGAAAAFMIVPPSIGSAWLRRRQMGRLRAQVALAAEAPLAGLRHHFESMNHDLSSQVVAHTADNSDDSRMLLAWTLAVNETGRALIELREGLLEASIGTSTVRVDIDRLLAALARFYERPDAAGYNRARAAAVNACNSAEREHLDTHLRDHLYLIRMALLDDDSVMAEYMPIPAQTEVEHAT